MFKQILVPLDGSQLAERVLPYVEQLAPDSGATLHLASVIELLPNPGWSPLPVYMDAAAYEAAERRVADYHAAVQERLAATGAPVRTAQLAGSVSAALLDYEREAGIDLVVMCSHGRTGLARFALGSVAGQLLRYGSAPVLLVRAFGATSIPEHTIVPLDGSPQAEAALRVVTGLQPRLVRQVTLLRVVEAEPLRAAAEEYLTGAALRVQQGNLIPAYRVEVGDPAEQIIDLAGTDKLVVMATHGRTGISRWALGSVADRVTRGSAAAVLLTRR